MVSVLEHGSEIRVNTVTTVTLGDGRRAKHPFLIGGGVASEEELAAILDNDARGIGGHWSLIPET
jgi:hypothetical protein